MHARVRRLAAVLLAIAAVASRADEAAAPLVRYADDRLTVRLADVPVGTVLAEIAAATGAEIRGQPAETRTVRATFDDVPLTEALERLLGRNSFSVVYGDDGRLRAIRLLGTSTAVLTPAAPRPVAAPPGATIVEILGTQPPTVDSVRPGVEGPPVRLDELARRAVTAESGGTRAAAMRTLNRAVEERGLREALVAASGGAESASVEDLLRWIIGANWERVLEGAPTDAEKKELRLRSVTLIRRLRNPPLPVAAAGPPAS